MTRALSPSIKRKRFKVKKPFPFKALMLLQNHYIRKIITYSLSMNMRLTNSITVVTVKDRRERSAKLCSGTQHVTIFETLV